MVKRLMHFYLGAAVILFGIFLIAGFTFSVEKTYTRAGRETARIENLREVSEETGAIGEAEKIYCFEIPFFDFEARDLAIYTVHQDIKVLIGDEPIYERSASGKNLFGKTPGCLWHYISLAPDDVGETVRVRITSPYKGNLDITPEVYIGSRNDIYSALIYKTLLPMLIGVITAGLGIAFIIYVYVPRKKISSDKSLGYLGIFALDIGIWQVSEVLAALGIARMAIGVSYVSYISLLLMTIPFIMFVRNLYSSKDSKIWDVICIFSLVQILVEVVCLLFGIADFKQMLWSNTIPYGMGILTSIFMVYREMRTGRLNEKLKRNLVCLILCGAGIVLDFIRYFSSNGNCVSIYGTACFLIYVIFVGVMSVADANKLIEQGREAGRFKKMAYQDSLTGTLSRAAFEEAIAKQESKKENCIIVMFDLNDLKKCNDTLGHKAGDKYIKESAELISRVFRDLGKCYRIGGDEFCVLIPHGNVQVLDETEKQFHEELNKYNVSPSDFQRFIAYGYAQFDSKLDTDLNDTRGRADAAMYRNKFQMKKGSNDPI